MAKKDKHRHRGSRSKKQEVRSFGSNRLSRNQWLILLGILAITLIVFIPSLNNGFTNYDDQVYVTENPLITGSDLQKVITEPAAGNYHPLTMLSLILNFKLSGLEPFSYHLLNLLFHLLNTALVFYFLSFLSRGRFDIPIIGALIFGIHPMHVESVAWISERKDVLYVFFFLAGLITYIKYFNSEHIKWYIGTVGLFLLSALSKPAAVVFPLILLLLDYFFERKFDRKAILEKIPFFIVSLIFGIVTIKAQQEEAIGTLEHYNLGQQFSFATYGMVMYIVKLFVPYQLSALHPYPNPDESLPVIFMAAPVIAIAVIALVIYSAKKTRVVLFGFLFYLVSILLVLQFVSVGRAVMAERYTYLAYIGLAFIIGYGYVYLVDRYRSVKQLIIGVFAIYFLIMGYLAFQRTKVWENAQTLWSDVIEKYPKDWYAYVGRGNFYLDENELQKAFKDYNKAISLKTDVADPYQSRGNLYRKNKNFEKALQDYNKALSIKPQNATILSDRGSLYFDMGKYEKALKDFHQALSIKPDIPEVYNNIGSVYSIQGDYEKGIQNFNKAIELNSLFPDAYLNRGILLTMTKKYQQAKADYERYFNLIKDKAASNAYYWRGTNNYNLSRYQQAIEDYTDAIKLAPNIGDYYLQRSKAYLALGNKSNALKDAQKAQSMGVQVEQGYLNQLR